VVTLDKDFPVFSASADSTSAFEVFSQLFHRRFGPFKTFDQGNDFAAALFLVEVDTEFLLTRLQGLLVII